MYKHILIPTDGSARTQAAVERGIEIAKESGAQITVITVSEPFHVLLVEPMPVRDTANLHDRQAEVKAAIVLDRVSAAASIVGVTCRTIHLQHDSVYTAIIETAEQRGCDLILMALRRGHGISTILHESKTIQVLKHCTIPVLVL